MLSRLFLAAGVAALAIAAPAYAGPHGGGGGGGHGNGNGNGGGGPHGGGGGGGGPHGGGGGGQPVFAGGGGGGHGNGGGHGGGGAPMFMGGGGRGHGGGGGFARPQMQVQREQFHGFQRQQSRSFAQQRGHGGGHQQQIGFAQQRGHGGGHQQMRFAQQQHGRGHAFAQQQGGGFARQQGQRGHGHAFAQQQGGGFARQQGQRGHGHAFAQQQGRQQMRGFGRQQANGQQFRGNPAQQQAFNPQQIAPQQFGGRGGFNGQRAQFANRQAFQQYVAPPAYSNLSYGNSVQVYPAPQMEQFIGAPYATVNGLVGLAALPVGIQYLYPDTPDYYYRYGDGYLYQVNRADNLIAALIPLLAGGYLPGQYLPAAYMDSYVPAYYGYSSFYPDYGDVCNRYYYGVIYQVDCNDGYVENVIPAYAGGYGVGQILPSAYSYYNVPYQYRSYYYNTADTGYWYAPGAIYQYDPRSSMITSVAALLSPGFSVGQPLPAGYGVYNVPYDYRATYYDTPTAWYRYNNGYIYQVDPTTQLVTAIVASLLT